MVLEQASTSATGRRTGSPTGATGLTLAGLIDVLDRADDPVLPRRPRPRRAAPYRSPHARVVADRWDPLRTTAPRPEPRKVSRAVPVRPVPLAPSTRLPAAPGTALPRTPDARAPYPPAPPVPVPVAARTGLRARLRVLVRRVALWGAGTDGAYLAWGAPAHRVYRVSDVRVAGPARRTVDPPVVLREMPSTPTIRPAASSPAAVSSPATPMAPGWRTVSADSFRGRPTVVRPSAVLAARSAGHPSGRVPAAAAAGLSARSSVPARARAPDPATGIRGSPGTPPARGSPPVRQAPG
jgi:hypothetical protein